MFRARHAKFATRTLFALFAALQANAASCIQIDVKIDRYVLYTGRDATYFDGRFLTASDFSSEQAYMMGGKRYLGPTNLDPAELFTAVGAASLVLGLDDATLFGKDFSGPTNTSDPHADDFVVLDTDKHKWRGRLFVPGPNGSAGGVYDDLVGTFSDLRVVPESSALALVCAAGVAAMAGAVTRRRKPRLTVKMGTSHIQRSPHESSIG